MSSQQPFQNNPQYPPIRGQGELPPSVYMNYIQPQDQPNYPAHVNPVGYVPPQSQPGHPAQIPVSQYHQFAPALQNSDPSIQMNQNSPVNHNIPNQIVQQEPNQYPVGQRIQFARSPQTQKEKLQLKRHMYKTEICQNIVKYNFCHYGNKCAFAHEVTELRPKTVHPLYKTKTCLRFQNTGHCPFGNRCKFIHGGESVINVPLNPFSSETPITSQQFPSFDGHRKVHQAAPIASTVVVQRLPGHFLPNERTNHPAHPHQRSSPQNMQNFYARRTPQNVPHIQHPNPEEYQRVPAVEQHHHPQAFHGGNYLNTFPAHELALPNLENDPDSEEALELEYSTSSHSLSHPDEISPRSGRSQNQNQGPNGPTIADFEYPFTIQDTPYTATTRPSQSSPLPSTPPLISSYGYQNSIHNPNPNIITVENSSHLAQNKAIYGASKSVPIQYMMKDTRQFDPQSATTFDDSQMDLSYFANQHD